MFFDPWCRSCVRDEAVRAEHYMITWSLHFDGLGSLSSAKRRRVFDEGELSGWTLAQGVLIFIFEAESHVSQPYPILCS